MATSTPYHAGLDHFEMGMHGHGLSSPDGRGLWPMDVAQDTVLGNDIYPSDPRSRPGVALLGRRRRG